MFQKRRKVKVFRVKNPALLQRCCCLVVSYSVHKQEWVGIRDHDRCHTCTPAACQRREPVALGLEYLVYRRSGPLCFFSDSLSPAAAIRGCGGGERHHKAVPLPSPDPPALCFFFFSFMSSSLPVSPLVSSGCFDSLFPGTFFFFFFFSLSLN